MKSNETQIAIILTKLDTIHDNAETSHINTAVSLKEIKKEIAEITGRVSKNVKDIALMKQAEDDFIRKADIGGILWKVLSGVLFVLGFFGFVFTGWLKNTVQETLSENINDDIKFVIQQELENNYSVVEN